MRWMHASTNQNVETSLKPRESGKVGPLDDCWLFVRFVRLCTLSLVIGCFVQAFVAETAMPIDSGLVRLERQALLL